jgi:predicted metal-dependent peptidase
MQKARAKLLLQHVFWAGIIIPTPMIEDESIPTAMTDMVSVTYNPKFINSLTTEVVLFVLVHEAMHIMLKHGIRRGNRDPIAWNCACDFAINIQLKDWGFTLWDQCLVDPKYRGMSAEQIYDSFPKRGGGRGGEGRKPGEKPQPGDDDFQGGFGGDLQEPKNMDAEGKAKIEREINGKITQAHTIARMAGKMPADLDKLLKDFLNPKVPWFEELQQLLTRVCYDEENWSRRNRRVQDYYLPSRYNLKAGEIVVIGDTSGSMQQPDMDRAAGEINGVKDQINPERIRVVWADAKDCNHMETFEDGEDLVLHPKGGGGTNMCLPMKFVEQFDPRVVIMITDCETPWPKTEPDYPLIVVSTTKKACPWGRTIHVTTA